jgi:hypothetical protein
MDGFLHKKENEWVVKWSDLHSFGHGTHWMYTAIHPSQQSLSILSDGTEDWLAKCEGKKVTVEFITDGYDAVNYTPYNYAKIIVPVEILERMSKNKQAVTLIKVPDGLMWFDEEKPPIRFVDDNILKIGMNYYKIKDLKRIIKHFEL